MLLFQIFSTTYCFENGTKEKKLSREEILERKREAERKRYERMKNDPEKRETLREKERLKYQKKKEKGIKKLVKDMTPREHREAKKKWKVYAAKHRNKTKALRNVTNAFLRENTPESEQSNRSLPVTPEVSETIRKTKKKEKMLRY